MLYALLAYHEEGAITSMTPDQDAALMTDLYKVHDRLTQKGSLGPAARLDLTQSATTLRRGTVMDGPFAETKEQLLGIYVVDCATHDEAIDAARDLSRANPSAVYEIRPITIYLPGLALGGDAPAAT